MANNILSSLLREYKQKKLQAEINLEIQKEKIYILYPRLQEIHSELHDLGIQSTKSILLNPKNSTAFIEQLNNKISDLKKEEQDILIKNGYSKNFFTPNYECKICQDTGYITDSNLHTSMCSCLKQKLLDISFNKSNMYNLKKENFDNFDESNFSDEVNLLKYKVNISPKKNILNIKEKCIDFIKNFDDPEGKNLMFTGATGLR